MENVLTQAERFKKLGASLKESKMVLFVGRGTMYPIALEGALKMKELTYRHAEGFAAGELKHGSIAYVDEKVTAVVLAPSDELEAKTLSNLEEIRSRKARIIGVGEVGNRAFERLCDEFIGIPRTSEGTSPLLYVLPLQLLAYGFAQALGCNIDKPRNLAKSVTVE
jgi:glucosamine--fructose-6-phosphate aminotransferase (isomerizing)